MSSDKEHITGRIPSDDYQRFERIKERWSAGLPGDNEMSKTEAHKRVFSAGLDAIEDNGKTFREQLANAMTWLVAAAILMWVLGRAMPNIPESSASMAAWITFAIAGVLLVVWGLLDWDLPGIVTLLQKLGVRQ